MKDIDKKLIETISRYTASGIEQQVDYEKFYLYSLITHSTAIEGSTVTEVENQLLFDEGIAAKGRSLVEQMMNVDLKNAYLFGFEWAKTSKPYTLIFSVLNGQKHPSPIQSIFYASWQLKSCDVRVLNTPQWAATLIPQKVSCADAT